MNSTILRSKYVSSSIETMSPGRLIVALYDRLLLDLDRAADAITAADAETSHECLVHAQQIISELHDSLDVERWPGARTLADLYAFLYLELVDANVAKDAARVTTCRGLIAPLRDTWFEAAGIAPSPAGGTR
jgi:flagellar protein FliS